MSIFIAILGLAGLVLIHEAGHFFAARGVGMRPRKVYIGFPPPLVKVRSKGIEYGVGAIPRGGYVKIGSRGFAMRLPDNYDNKHPYALFFGFHWNGGNSKEVDTGGSNGYSMAHFGLQKL